MENKQHLDLVQKMYARKINKMGCEIEKLARFSVERFDRSITQELWLAQNVLYQIVVSLNERQGKNSKRK